MSSRKKKTHKIEIVQLHRIVNVHKIAFTIIAHKIKIKNNMKQLIDSKMSGDESFAKNGKL